MILSKDEERLSNYIDELNHRKGPRNRDESDDIEWLEMLDAVDLIKLSSIVEMPSPDFHEKVRGEIKEEVKGRRQTVPKRKLNISSWKTYFPLVAACLVVLSVCLPNLFPVQKVDAKQISVVKEEQLIQLGVTKVNYPFMLPDEKRFGFEKDDKIAIWNQADNAIKDFPLDSLQYMRSPEWSHNGKKVAFSGYKTKNAGIWLMEQDGSNIRLLSSPDSPEEFYDHPSWSPDGKQIAFAKQSFSANDSHGFSKSSEEIWVIDIKTGKLKKITDGSEPRWSPNGSEIAYTKTFTKGENIQKEVWLINTNGSNPRKLTDGMEPNWSPDGQFITYAKITTIDQKIEANQQKADLVASFREIWAIHVDSRKESRLTKSKLNEKELNELIHSSNTSTNNLPVNFTSSGQFSDWQPGWSKDGKSIIFVRDTNEEKGDHFSLIKINIKYE